MPRVHDSFTSPVAASTVSLGSTENTHGWGSGALPKGATAPQPLHLPALGRTTNRVSTAFDRCRSPVDSPPPR